MSKTIKPNALINLVYILLVVGVLIALYEVFVGDWGILGWGFWVITIILTTTWALYIQMTQSIQIDFDKELLIKTITAGEKTINLSNYKSFKIQRSRYSVIILFLKEDKAKLFSSYPSISINGFSVKEVNEALTQYFQNRKFGLKQT